MTQTYKKGKLYDLPIIDLKPDPNQPRKSMDPQALEELTASVQRVGIIQPLLFRVAEGGQISNLSPDSANLSPRPLYLVAGERRFKAAQLAGLTTVPGICVEGNPSEIALVENLLRQDLRTLNFSRNLANRHSSGSRNPVLSRSSGFPLSRE